MCGQLMDFPLASVMEVHSEEDLLTTHVTCALVLRSAVVPLCLTISRSNYGWNRLPTTLFLSYRKRLL